MLAKFRLFGQSLPIRIFDEPPSKKGHHHYYMPHYHDTRGRVPIFPTFGLSLGMAISFITRVLTCKNYVLLELV